MHLRLHILVMDDIAFDRKDISLPLPRVIGNMAHADAQIKRLIRQPEIGKDAVFVVVIVGQEHRHQRRDNRFYFLM